MKLIIVETRWLELLVIVFFLYDDISDVIAGTVC